MTPEDAVVYLLGHRLLDPRDLVHGTVRVEDASRRNRNLRIASTRGSGYFLKQADPAIPGSAQTVGREASLYQRAQGDPGLEALGSLLPRLRLHDPDRALLVLELERETETLEGLVETMTGDELLAIAPSIAGAMAGYHALPNDLDLPRLLPWVFGIARPGPEALSSLSPAQIELLRIIQQDARVVEFLDHLPRIWSPTGLIHGDFKWSHVLVTRSLDRQPPVRVLLVDWELSGFGDIAWDVGSALQAYLLHALHSLPVTGAETADHVATLFTTRALELQPAVQAFWLSYRRGAGLTGVTAQVVLERAAEYCAARLLQSAYEAAHQEPELGGLGAGLLQLGTNLCHDPEGARTRLLGLRA